MVVVVVVVRWWWWWWRGGFGRVCVGVSRGVTVCELVCMSVVVRVCSCVPLCVRV